MDAFHENVCGRVRVKVRPMVAALSKADRGPLSNSSLDKIEAEIRRQIDIESDGRLAMTEEGLRRNRVATTGLMYFKVRYTGQGGGA